MGPACGCCSCPSHSIIWPLEWHRDLGRPPGEKPLTGDIGPAAVMLGNDEVLGRPCDYTGTYPYRDAVERLHVNGGDVLYTDIETFAAGATIDSHSVSLKSANQKNLSSDAGIRRDPPPNCDYLLPDISEDQPGCVKVAFELTPTQPIFTAGVILWTGETYDPHAHIDHLAYGSLDLDSSIRRDLQSAHLKRGEPEWAYMVCGLAIRDSTGRTLFRVNGLTNGTDVDGGLDRCWMRMTRRFAMPNSNQFVESPDPTTGRWTAAPTVYQDLKAMGLTSLPLTPHVTYEVGVVIAITTSRGGVFEPSSLDQLRPTYKVGVLLDDICISATYDMHCHAAFHDKTALIASVPESEDPLNNDQMPTEPIELRGVEVDLSLELYSAPTMSQTYDPLYIFKLYGQGYRGFTTLVNGITLTVHYTPCELVVLQFSGGSLACDIFVPIGHGPVDANPIILLPITGPGITGRESTIDPAEDTIETIGSAGIAAFAALPPIVTAEEDYETIDTTERCLETDLGTFDGCYSLAPIAIGYRRRLSNYDPAGTGLDCQTNPCQDPVVNLGKRCPFFLLRAAGFTNRLEYVYTAITGHVVTAYWFWVDITEPPPP